MALYDRIGHGYAAFRKPDERIASAIDAALEDSHSVVNIGAGTGSYEPMDRAVLAIEPSESMIRQRREDAAPCIRGVAESLPLNSDSVDAAMAVLSAHHWAGLEQGLCEMARVARKRVVLLTWIPDSAPFWLTQEYFPEILAHDRMVFPDSFALTELLERIIGRTRITPVLVPHDCTDGFLCAYWRRPEFYLCEERRRAISSFAKIDAENGITRLCSDLSSGLWTERNSSLLQLDSMDVGYRIICCEIGGVDD